MANNLVTFKNLLTGQLPSSPPAEEVPGSQTCAPDETVAVTRSPSSRDSDDCSSPTPVVQQQEKEEGKCRSITPQTKKRSSTRTRWPPQPPHRIFVGYQARNGAFYTEAHAAFLREVKVWQIRNGGRTFKERLKKKGELETVVNFLLEEVHKKIKTMEFPEIYCRPSAAIGAYKVEMEKNVHRDMLIDYLVGKRGSCLTGSLRMASEQLAAYRPYLTEKQFERVERFVRCHWDVLSSNVESASNGNEHGESNLMRLDEIESEALLQSANSMLAAALKNEPPKKKKARTTSDAKLSGTPKSRRCMSTDQKSKEPRISRGMGTDELTATENVRQPLPDSTPTELTMTRETIRLDEGGGNPGVASTQVTVEESLPSSALKGGSYLSLDQDISPAIFSVTEDDISLFSDIEDEADGQDETQSNNQVSTQSLNHHHHNRRQVESASQRLSFSPWPWSKDYYGMDSSSFESPDFFGFTDSSSSESLLVPPGDASPAIEDTIDRNGDTSGSQLFRKYQLDPPAPLAAAKRNTARFSQDNEPNRAFLSPADTAPPKAQLIPPAPLATADLYQGHPCFKDQVRSANPLQPRMRHYSPTMKERLVKEKGGSISVARVVTEKDGSISVNGREDKWEFDGPQTKRSTWKFWRRLRGRAAKLNNGKMDAGGGLEQTGSTTTGKKDKRSLDMLEEQLGQLSLDTEK